MTPPDLTRPRQQGDAVSVRASFFDHADNRSIAVRRWMIEETRQPSGDADYASAVLLAQITFWTQPDERTGRARAEHVHGGCTWLVRADSEWMDEIGMAVTTVRRSRKRLADLGWIEARTLVDAGVRCSHIRRLTPACEPSTIRSGSAIEEMSTGDPEHIQTAILSESHAGASPLSSREVVETPAEPDPAKDLVTAFWEYRKREGLPEPTLATGGRGNPFMALTGVVRHLLDAGWEPRDVKRALAEAPIYTINALTLLLNKQRKAATNGENPFINTYRDERSHG